MGKIKIGLVILISLALVGLIFGGIVLAKPPLFEGPENPKGEKGEYVPDEIIVKFKGDVKPFRVIKVLEGKVGEKIKEYLKRGDVEYAEPNYIAYTQWAPNDEFYYYQWHLDNTYKWTGKVDDPNRQLVPDNSGGVNGGGINIEPAWDITTGATSVIVAIIDTGIAYETYGKYCQAPDLALTNFVSGYDFVNNDSHPNDDNRHGTHVAGTVAQSTNNSLGVAGVAFSTSLMPVKVLNSRGSGTYANVAKGIIFAADNGAKVINLSLGGSASDETLKGAVQYAYEKGVTVIAACGNDNASTCLYPAAYDDYVIAVGATQYDETKAPYSSYGPSLDLVAPGGNNNLDQNKDGYADGVLQQTFASSYRLCTFGYYFFQGTSMAAPHVSGVAALLIANGNATIPDQIRTALQETAEFKLGRDDIYGGHGLVDAYAALQWTTAPVIACSIHTDCDDGNECTTDVCVYPGTIDAYCSNTAVADGTSCEDGLYCNGAEVCQAGVCQAGAPPCNDGIDCTVDTCDEANQTCTYTPNDTLCDDGSYCNGAETCDATLGCQAGTPIVCDDSNDCTTDTCSDELKACQYTNVVDNTPCTDGVCCSGVCQEGISECPVTKVMCWSGTNQYLYRNNGQASKFCKCASGIYGYSRYNYTLSRKTVFYYIDSGNNENWEIASRSSNLPVYQVTCTDGKAYPTNVDYTYPK